MRIASLDFNAFHVRAMAEFERLKPCMTRDEYYRKVAVSHAVKTAPPSHGVIYVPAKGFAFVPRDQGVWPKWLVRAVEKANGEFRFIDVPQSVRSC